MRRLRPPARRAIRALFALALFALTLVVSRSASANPEAHILRIDPRAGMTGGSPILSTVVEIVEFSSPSEALAPCNNLSGSAALDCWSSTIEKDNVLWKGFDFGLVQKNAVFTVKV